MSSSRYASGIAAVVLAAGCFSVPPYEPKTRVSYTEAGTGAIVAGTDPGNDFALRFADGDGFHFPDALMIDGVDVMGHDPVQGCYREDETGLLIAPAPRISAHGPAEPVKSGLTPVLHGPAVVQVKVDWTTKLTCDNIHNPGGTSTFTVFLDGRIVRHDTIDDPDKSMLSPVSCACEPPPSDPERLFNISTYWTLARAGLSDLHLPDEAPQPLPDPASGGFSNKLVSCVNGGGYQVAFAWSDVRDTSIRTTDALISFGRTVAVGATDLVGFSTKESSAIFIEHGSCATALARADEHTDPSSLTINKVSTKPAARDGIYGGDGGVVEPGIELEEDRAELSGLVPDSFAVWLRFSRSVDAVRATLEGGDAKGEWYLPQRVDDRSWILWFREPLLIDQKITIEPI